MQAVMRTNILRVYESENERQAAFCPQRSREQSVALERRSRAICQLRISRRRPVNGDVRAEPRLLFVDHGTAQDRFGASVFWMRRMAAVGGEQAAIEDWQIKRDGTERGIVEITAE